MRTPRKECDAAKAEFPWRGVSHDMADAAHGVINNSIAEVEAVARLMDLPLRNRPPTRPATGAPAQQPDNGWHPSNGSPQEFFKDTVTLTEKKHGAWVAVRLKALGIKGKRWRLSKDELWAEILMWISVNGRDIELAEEASRRRTEGERVVPHRPRAKTFVVSEECFVEEAQGKIWDLRPYWEADAADRHNVEIRLMKFDEQNSSFNVDALAEACSRAKVPDALMAEAICKGGVWRPFTGTWALVLEPNSRGFYDHINFAQETTKNEIDSGVLKGPYEGPAFMPSKFHSRGVALQFRNGKIKPRGTGNLSLHGDFKEHGTNSGWDLKLDMYSFPELEYVTSQQFARDCGVARPASAKHDFEIRKNECATPSSQHDMSIVRPAQKIDHN